MNVRVSLLIAALAVSFAAGCKKPYKIQGGRNECAEKCRAEGLELTGMVFLGTAADACVCEVPGRASGGIGPTAAAGAAALMQDDEAAAHQQQQQQQQQAAGLR